MKQRLKAPRVIGFSLCISPLIAPVLGGCAPKSDAGVSVSGDYVRSQISYSQKMKNTSVRADVSGNTVTLSGKVQTPEQKAEAAAIAQKAAPGKQIVNGIEVG